MKTSPLLMDIPTEITTDRLRLRCPRFGDGTIVFDLVRASLVELKRWMPWASDEYAPNDAEEWCRKSAAKFLSREELAYLIFLADGSYVGNLSLFSFYWTVPKCEVGYWLGTAYCGRGLMTEAVQAVTQFAKERLSIIRVEIQTDAGNHRSRRVAERCGYVLEATLRKVDRDRAGELRDSCIYAHVS